MTNGNDEKVRQLTEDLAPDAADLLYLVKAGGGDRKVQVGNLPASGTSLVMQYIEWTFDDAGTKTVDIAPETLIMFGAVNTLETWDGGDAVINIGTGDTSPTSYLNGSAIADAGQVYTVGDMGDTDTDPLGNTLGFPYSHDDFSWFPDGGTIIGTVTATAEATGKTRFYFLACTVAAATLA